MRDVNNGWLVRYIHSNTASAFFLLVYLHVGRGMYYGSYRYPRLLTWVLGTTILIMLMAIAFLGYVLPFGQMSLWGDQLENTFFLNTVLVSKKLDNKFISSGCASTLLAQGFILAPRKNYNASFYTKLDSWLVTGFCDAESSFMINVIKRPDIKVGWRV